MSVLKLIWNNYSSENNNVHNLSYYRNFSDSTIWEKFKGGDENAFAFIYQEHTSSLFNFGCQSFGKRELIKDCIQELFIELKTNRQKLSKVTSIRTYLYKSLYNKVKRKLKKQGMLLLYEQPTQYSFSIEIPVVSSIIQNETIAFRIKWLQDKLNKLNVRQKQAILLFYYEGLTYKEVSEVMGLKSEDASRMLVKRGLEKIKENINKEDDTLFLSSIMALMMLGNTFF